MKYYSLFGCILLLFARNYAHAQSYYAGLFTMLDHSAELNHKFSYGLYYFGAFPFVNLQHPNPTKDVRFLLFYSEQSISYKCSNHFSVTGSYVYQRTNAVYDSYVNENRFYAQAQYKHHIHKIQLSHRLRYDGRFIQNRINHETPFTNRVRYQLGFAVPLRDKFYLVAYEEAFFNTYKGAPIVYGENWAYAGLGKKLNEQHKIEAGILYVSWNTGPGTWFNQYYLQISWISHFDFRKKQNS